MGKTLGILFGMVILFIGLATFQKEHWVQRLEDCFDERGKFICCECDCK